MYTTREYMETGVTFTKHELFVTEQICRNVLESNDNSNEKWFIDKLNGISLSSTILAIITPKAISAGAGFVSTLATVLSFTIDTIGSSTFNNIFSKTQKALDYYQDKMEVYGYSKVKGTVLYLEITGNDPDDKETIIEQFVPEFYCIKGTNTWKSFNDVPFPPFKDK